MDCLKAVWAALIRATLDLCGSQCHVRYYGGGSVWEFAKAYEQTLVSNFESWKAEGVSNWLHKLTGIGAMRGIELRHPKHGTSPEIMAKILSEARDKGLLLMPVVNIATSSVYYAFDH